MAEHETEIGSLVIKWLEEEGWDVYQEVTCLGSCADVVGVLGTKIWAVELKATLTLDVIDQARNWKKYATFCSVAVPAAKRHRSRLGGDVLRWQGLGLLEANFQHRTVRQLVPPGVNRHILGDLREAIRPEHKTFARAGSQWEKRWTPFVDTCTQLREAVAKTPGMSIKDALSKIRHHYANYASARAALCHWILAGKVPGVRASYECGKLLLYPG